MTLFDFFRQSGFGRCDSGLYAHDQCCETSTIQVDLPGRQGGEGVDG